MGLSMYEGGMIVKFDVNSAFTIYYETNNSVVFSDCFLDGWALRAGYGCCVYGAVGPYRSSAEPGCAILVGDAGFGGEDDGGKICRQWGECEAYLEDQL